MRRVAGFIAVLLLTSWLTMPLAALAAIKVAVIEVKGMVCHA
jgi:hypothetical protein